MKKKSKKQIKINGIYKNANTSKDRYRVLYGGAGSGKSHFAGQELLLNMMSSKNYSYLVVRKTGKSIRNSVFRLLTEMISEYELTSYFSINKTEMMITCITGASMITSGLDDVEKLKSVANINRIWVEEASEITEKDFNQLDLRLRGQSKVGYQMTLTFNPISELHWLKKSFFDVGRNGAFVLKTTFKDNNFLDDRYIQTLNDLKEQDYQYYRVYALGEWGSLGNVIYSNWSKQDLSDVKDSFDNIYNGIDWGFGDDPTAFVRVHFDKTRKVVYVLDEFAKHGEFIDDIATDLHKRIGDELITCDSSEPRSVADLRRNGIKALAAKKGPGSIEHGIKWLQGHRIVVDSSCIETIKELSTYKWKEDKDGNIIPKPVDKDNHLLDSLRYALESEMKNNKLKVKTFKGGI